jgi:hypothetical protein
MIDVVGIDIKWDKCGSKSAGEYTFLCGKGKENYVLDTGFSVHQIIISAVKKVEFVSDRMSHIILRGR